MAPREDAAAHAAAPKFWDLFNSVVTPLALIITTTIAVIGVTARQTTSSSSAAFLRALQTELTAQRSLTTLAIIVLIGVIGSANGRTRAGILYDLKHPLVSPVSFWLAIVASVVLVGTSAATGLSMALGLFMLPNPWWVPGVAAMVVYLLLRRMPTEVRHSIAEARLKGARRTLKMARKLRDQNIERSKEGYFGTSEESLAILQEDAKREKDAEKLVVAMGGAYHATRFRSSKVLDVVMRTVRQLVLNALLVAGAYGGIGLILRATDQIPDLGGARGLAALGGAVAGYVVGSALRD